MTAAASAAHLLAILDKLPSVTKPRTDKDVLLAEAAAAIRDLLAVVGELERAVEEEAQLDEVLDRVRDNIREHVAANLGSPDLSHLPARAADGEDMCRADSPRSADGMYWDCTARRGHVEQWHATHRADGSFCADIYNDAAWPVVAKETGLPAWIDGSACGAPEGRWACNAVLGHEPLDHVAFAPWSSRMPGAVLARWPSAQPTPSGMDAQMIINLNGHALRPHRSVCTCPMPGGCADVGCRACFGLDDCLLAEDAPFQEPAGPGQAQP